MSKFIYVIDHDIQRYERLYKAYVVFSEYSFVRFLQVLPPLQQFIEEAVCVCVHDSFPDSNSSYQLDTLYSSLIERNIFTVQFSNGGNQAVRQDSDGLTITMRSDTFYQNVNFLLQNFKDTSTIKIELLMYGSLYSLQPLLQINRQISKLLLNVEDPSLPIDLVNGRREELELSIKDFGKRINLDTKDIVKKLVDEELYVHELKLWLRTELKFIQ